MDLSELYEFKYTPNTFDEMILNADAKVKLRKALDELPNLILYGPSGTGKGTYVDVLKKTKGLDILKLNCSDETGIDPIRDKVKSFATCAGFGGIKIVYLNESDFLSINAQAMLRDLMESVQSVTRFIFCCNYIHKMSPELMSRCREVELTNPPAIDVVKRCWSILDKEGVTYDKKVVIELVKTIWKRKPDIRKALVILKDNVVDGVLQNNIIMSVSDGVYKEILDGMKLGDPEVVRQVLKSHQIDYTGLYKYLYDVLMNEDSVFKKDGEAILLVGQHDYRDNLVANREINFMTMYFDMIMRGVV
ncbi:MAG: replication factor C small subunit [Candidatus Izimaplasma bacterium HR2]|nr:MAG: replication factor C small subunit [Candidatus Izimaplasma bacterium HR2]